MNLSQLSQAPGDYLQCRTVARVLNVSLRHVYRLIENGDLSAVRIGTRHLRVARSSLLTFLESVRGETGDPVGGAHKPGATRNIRRRRINA